MGKFKGQLESEALDIIQRLLDNGSVTAKEAALLIRAIIDKRMNKVTQFNIPPQTPPVAPTPTPTYPGFPQVYCQSSTAENPDKYTTTIIS